MSASCDIKKHVESVQKQGTEAINRMVVKFEQFGWFVIGQAQKLCPVATGFLRESGTVEKPVRSGNQITMIIGFGAAYSLAVHEATEKNFNTEANPFATSRFLATAVKESAPKLVPFMTGGNS